MVSARDIHALLKAADQAGARVLLVGDTQQLKAVQAGRPFAQLQQAGMACAQLQEIQRQQEPELKRAVEQAAAGDTAGSLAKLRTSVVEIVDHRDRHQRIAQDYAALTSAERAATLEKLDGSRLVLDPDKPLYLEHGYCQTVHAAQGQTCERVLIESPAASGAGNESSHYVAISRATHEVRIYTDDAQRLPETLSREYGKTAALDLQPERDKHESRAMALGA